MLFRGGEQVMAKTGAQPRAAVLAAITEHL
jgi:hypothetical protein